MYLLQHSLTPDPLTRKCLCANTDCDVRGQTSDILIALSSSRSKMTHKCFIKNGAKVDVVKRHFRAMEKMARNVSVHFARICGSERAALYKRHFE